MPHHLSEDPETRRRQIAAIFYKNNGVWPSYKGSTNAVSDKQILAPLVDVKGTIEKIAKDQNVHHIEAEAKKASLQDIVLPVVKTAAPYLALAAASIFAPPLVPLVHLSFTALTVANYGKTAYDFKNELSEWQEGTESTYTFAGNTTATATGIITNGISDKSAISTTNAIEQELGWIPKVGYKLVVEPILANAFSGGFSHATRFAVGAAFSSGIL